MANVIKINEEKLRQIVDEVVKEEKRKQKRSLKEGEGSTNVYKVRVEFLIPLRDNGDGPEFMEAAAKKKVSEICAGQHFNIEAVKLHSVK